MIVVAELGANRQVGKKWKKRIRDKIDLNIPQFKNDDKGGSNSAYYHLSQRSRLIWCGLMRLLILR